MIDERAQIHPSAKIADNVAIGPWTVIGPDVEIGSHTWIGSHVVIDGPTKIGAHNKIFQFASVGGDPQDKRYHGEVTYLEIGDHNVIREYCSLNRGTVQGNLKTQIGNHNLFMANVHIAHDCIIGNHVTIANNCAMAGHVTIKDRATLGGFTAIHQFCTVGEYCFTGGGSLVSKDVPPYLLVMPDNRRAVALGVNVEGLKRNNFTPEEIQQIQRAYKIIYRKGLRLQDAIEELKTLAENTPKIQLMVDFLSTPGRGIIG